MTAHAAGIESLLGAGAPVTVELIAARDGVAPGQPLWVALRLRHQPGWHTYWQVPGDAGLPTRVRWLLPPGFAPGPLGWPLPHRLPVGPLVDYGYEGEVLLPARLAVPAELPAEAGRELVLGAQVEWLMCREVCVPGRAQLRLPLPWKPPQAIGPGAWGAAIEAAVARLPGPLAQPGLAATRAGGRIRLRLPLAGRPPRRLEFYPLEADRIEAAAPQPLRAAAGAATLELTAHEPQDPGFTVLRGLLVADGGPEEGGWAGTFEVPIRSLLSPPP